MKRLFWTVSLLLSACVSQENSYPLDSKPQNQEKAFQFMGKDAVYTIQKAIHFRSQSESFYEGNRQFIEEMKNRVNIIKVPHNLPKVSAKEYTK